MSKLILGVDPSYTSSGWAIFSPENLSCINWGTIKTNTKEITIFRFLRIKEELTKIIQKYNIKRAGCEAPVFGGYETGTAYALYVSLLEVLYLNKVDAVFLAPLQIQKILKAEGYGISGKIFKSDSKKAAEDFLKGNLPNRATGDKADAFHAARIGFRFWNFYDNLLNIDELTQAEREIFTQKHTFKRGKKAGQTEKKGIIYRENELFFLFSKLEFRS